MRRWGPEGTERLIRHETAGRGATVLVSSHDLEHVVDVCSRVLVLAEGRIVHDTPSTPATLAELRAFFAGGGVAAPASPRGRDGTALSRSATG